MADQEETKTEKVEETTKAPEIDAFEAWLAKQDEATKAMLSGHTSGLKSALEAERKAAKEAKASIKRLAELEEQEKKRKEAEMSEAEKLKAELDALKTEAEKARSQARQTKLEADVKLQAAALNFADPADALKMLDMGSIEFDDSGNPKGIKEALEALSKSKPYLLKTASGPGTPPGAGKKTGTTQKNDQTPTVSTVRF